MLVSKNAKICVNPNANVKFPQTPTQTPNAHTWNIGRFGSPMQKFSVGYVDFMLFVLISFTLVTQHEPSLPWNMALINLLQFNLRFSVSLKR